jgi:ribonucleoside-diphosphate reductase alpha chain
MLRVVRNHRRAAMGVARTSDEYEDLRIRPVPIDHSLVAGNRINLTNAADLLDRSVACWDDALGYGEKFGYRNAQTTVIAPTGTIGLLMDCDTTGVEPDFALVKFKKLAGGGYFKIANQSLRPAIRALGYSSEQADDMVTYVMGTLSLDVAVPAVDGTAVTGAGNTGAFKAQTFRDFLLAKGFTHEQLLSVENNLPTVFELAFAFSAWSMPESVLANCGVDAVAAKSDMSFNGLRALGLTRKQIDVLNRTICGTQTIEGAPHLKDEHLPVFDCANRCGPLSERFIKPEGHIRMMAASQPFITGAISKTINLPSDASVEDIGACYRLSWELGLKANALYRDGCKLSQPLSTKSDKSEEDDKKDDSKVDSKVAAVAAAETPVTTAAEQAELVAEAATTTLTDMALAGEPVVADVREIVVERVVERIIERPMRRRLADTRDSVTHKFNVAGHEGYLIVGLYEDGRPGELFITMAKEGSTIGGLMDSLGTAISVALQYGVPVESLVTKFAHQRFEPMGMTTNADIPFAKSLVDYIFRWLGMQFITGYRELNSPRRSTPEVAKEAARDTHSTTPSVRDTNRDTSRDTGRDSHNDSKEDASCATGSGTTVSGWAARREAAIAAAETRTSVTSVVTDRAAVTEKITTETRTIEAVASVERISKSAVVAANALDASNAALMGDAPACDVCGSITVRNGTCYRCLNCGNSMGCS